jgi:hypothetical protein
MTAADTRRMSGAELLTIREALGLTGPWLAHRVMTTPRNERRWEADEYQIPDLAAQIVWELRDYAQQVVDDLLAFLHNLDHPRYPQPGLILFRTDEGYQQAAPLPDLKVSPSRHPGAVYPASWHRAIAFRALERVPGLRIAHFTDDEVREDTTTSWVKFVATRRHVDLKLYKRPTLTSHRHRD